MIRSLKDVAMKRHLSAIPDIGIYELEDNQDVTLFIGSDGATDIFYFHDEIGMICHGDGSCDWQTKSLTMPWIVQHVKE